MAISSMDSGLQTNLNFRFEGKLDDLIIFKTALSDAEIEILYNCTKLTSRCATCSLTKCYECLPTAYLSGNICISNCGVADTNCLDCNSSSICI